MISPPSSLHYFILIILHFAECNVEQLHCPALPILPESWWTDPACSNFSIATAQPSTYITRPVLAYQGSGSSWLVGLMEAATSHYAALTIKEIVAYFEYKEDGSRKWYRKANLTSGKFMTVKTDYDWWNGSSGKKLQDDLRKLSQGERRLILLIRNPWDAFLSWRQHSAKKIGRLHRKYFLKPDLEEQLLAFASEWVETNIRILRESKPEELLIVQYEKLKANTQEELIRIFNYLQVEVSMERLDCIDEHPITSCKRPPLSTKVSDIVGRRFSQMKNLNLLLEQGLAEINELLKPRKIFLNYHGLSLPNLRRKEGTTHSDEL